MADQNIGQLSIGVNLNSSNLNRSLEQMQRDLRMANQQFRTASAGVDRFSDSTQSLENKASALRTVIQQQEDVMQALAREYQRVAAAQGENSVQAQRLQTQYAQAQTRLATYNTQLRNTQRQIDNFGNSTNNAANQTQHLEEELNTAPGAAGKLGEALKGLAVALAAAFAVDKVKDFMTQLVEASADVQALNSQYSQVMGGMKNQTDQYLNEMSSKWNKHPNELKSALMQYMAILKGKGLSEQDAFETAKKYMDLTVDGNAFANEKMEDSTARLMGVIKGEYDSADTVMINFSQTMLNDKAFEVYGKKWDELNVTQQEALKTQEAIRQQTSAGVVGQGIREANSYANNLAMVQQTWKDLQAQMGAPILEIVNGRLKQLAEILKNVNLEEIKTQFTNFFAYLKATFGPSIDQFVSSIQNLKTTFIDSFNAISAAFASTGTSIAPSQAQIEGFIIRLIEIGSSVINVISKVVAFITPALVQITTFIGQQIAFIKKFWDENGAGITEGIKIAVGIILSSWQKMFNILQPIIQVAWNMIKIIFSTAINVILNTIKLFSSLLRGDWQGVSDALYSIMKNGIDNIKKVFSGLWSGVKGIISAFKENLKKSFDDLSLKEIGKNIINGLVEGLKAAMGAVKKIIDGVADDIPEWLKKKLG